MKLSLPFVAMIMICAVVASCNDASQPCGVFNSGSACGSDLNGPPPAATCGIGVPGTGLWWESNLPLAAQNPFEGGVLVPIQAVPPCNVLLCLPATANKDTCIAAANARLAAVNLKASSDDVDCVVVGPTVLGHNDHEFTLPFCATVETTHCSTYGTACAAPGDPSYVDIPAAICCATHTNGAALTCANSYLTIQPTAGGAPIELDACCIAAGQQCDSTLPSGGCCANPSEGAGDPALCGGTSSADWQHVGACCVPEGYGCLDDSWCCHSSCDPDDFTCQALGEKHRRDAGAD